MGKRKTRIAIVCLLIAAVAVLVWFFMRQQNTSPEYILRYAENQPADYPTSQGAEYFSKLVEERSNGRIRIIVYSSSELGKESDVITQMQYGGIDFARVSISQLAGGVPKLNVLQMPYLYRDSEHMWSVLDGEIGEDFLAETQDYDLIGLSWYDAGTRSFYNSVKSIERLEDMQGLKIRVQQSSLMSDVVQSLGATPVQITYEDVYSAIETGQVDGAENNWPSYESMLHYEVAEYYTEDEHSRIPEMQICSAHTWNRFSEEDQEIIRQAAKESAEYERELWAERVQSTKEKLIEKGIVVTELSPEEKKRFQDACKGVYEKYCGDDMDLIRRITNAE